MICFIYEQRALGEALASIAAIAHVENDHPTDRCRTRQPNNHQWFKIEKQDYVQGSHGTNFAVKTSFYNVPARRKFFEVGSS